MGTEDTTMRTTLTEDMDIETLRRFIFAGGVEWNENTLDEATSVMRSRGRVGDLVVERVVHKKRDENYGRAHYRTRHVSGERWETFEVATPDGRFIGSVDDVDGTDAAEVVALLRTLRGEFADAMRTVAALATSNAEQGKLLAQLAGEVAALKKKSG